MANMTLIEAKTSTTSSVTFSSIPGTYTDLRLLISSRDTESNAWTSMNIELNADTTSANYSQMYSYSTGSGTGGSSGAQTVGYSNSAGNTAAVFSNCEIYIPSYSATIAKSWTWNAVTGNMAAAQLNVFGLGNWTGTAPITQVKLTTQGTAFNTGSTFYLYGVPNASISAKATGGVIYSDSSYFYHIFPASGTFTPIQSLTADYLVVAGGGGGGGAIGGGGGAGGYRTSIGGTPLSVTAQAYTITVGGGGVKGGSPGYSAGSPSTFSTITSAGGGVGGDSGTYSHSPGQGGSGGGGGYDHSGASVSPAGQGFAGGNGFGSTAEYTCGGGGGAGQVGQNAQSNVVAGRGGKGLDTNVDWAIATGTGVQGYYAGGGGGGSRYAANAPGGLGGGGDGNGKNGLDNTGGGGGGAAGNDYNGGGYGGSGLIIIRYAI